MISGYHLTLTFYRYDYEIIIEVLTTGIEFGTVATHETRCLNQILFVNLIIYINLINKLDLFILPYFLSFNRILTTDCCFFKNNFIKKAYKDLCSFLTS